MPSALEAQAEAVARTVLPDEPREGERGIDLITVITLVISVITALIQNCPLPPSSVRATFRRPSLLQRAALLRQVKTYCDCCGQSRHVLSIYQTLLARASVMVDADADALIREAQTDQNLLI